MLFEKLGKNVIRIQIIAILNSIYGVFKVDLDMKTDISLENIKTALLKEGGFPTCGFTTNPM